MSAQNTMVVLLFILNALIGLSSVSGKARNSFELHQHTPIVANTVGPFNNPTETYPYYKLPFCTAGGKQRRHKQNLGEVLSGSRKVTTPYDLTFMDPVPWRSLCEEYLDAADVSKRRHLTSLVLIPGSDGMHILTTTSFSFLLPFSSFLPSSPNGNT